MTLDDVLAAVEALRALPPVLPEAWLYESENAPDGLYLSVSTDDGARLWREALKGTPSPLPVVSREIPRFVTTLATPCTPSPADISEPEPGGR